mmetsp:Transcript_56/g.127  ORF Transcript_56/g.127 Transcript_56/m.127 type:complete len:226 (-) Transcript_56:554-1231(-)|eukprot:CAMPEP_0201198166 /NCGR_PEP_ID=MMETSP0851-20130426/156200_1 /ASSEMBLY_ACC=CAM_ASM_000631 /TAXON_ID=183588 /ORGANISM="Pseudo-nitzschia fraudulenta, Strain WWA7" /LENGTH=225 /DNA_ID=CAMNT_0047485387 /DNA_START=160 /DNA_END=837 /DNA_ORIENTATION=+
MVPRPHQCDGHAHDPADADDLGLSLRPQMDLPAVTCLNEDRPNMGREVLKFHEERLSATPFLRSQEDDPELLLYIPFTEAVTMTHLSLRSAPNEGEGDYPAAPPRTIKVFSNRDNIDFDMARELEPQCQIDAVTPDHFDEGTIDYPLRPAGKFQNVSSLTLFVVDNFASGRLDDDEVSTIVTYIGVKGKGSRQKRMAVEAIYETRGMKKDHKVPGADFGAQNEIG